MSIDRYLVLNPRTGRSEGEKKKIREGEKEKKEIRETMAGRGRNTKSDNFEEERKEEPWQREERQSWYCPGPKPPVAIRPDRRR